MHRRPRLIEVAPLRPAPVTLSTSTDLVHVPTDRHCPTCCHGLAVSVWAQPALFYFGGEGRTTQHRRRHCPMCGWTATDLHSLSPRRA